MRDGIYRVIDFGVRVRRVTFAATDSCGFAPGVELPSVLELRHALRAIDLDSYPVNLRFRSGSVALPRQVDLSEAGSCLVGLTFQ
jgi:hypothetical protein